MVVSFYPGHGGPSALAGVLSGRVNPSGRLPITYPRYPNSRTPYDHKSSENRKIQGAPVTYQPEFDFGTGLRYTECHYETFKVSKLRFLPEEPLRISVIVTNTGTRAGGHIVQLFSTDHYASVTPSVRRLRAFQRVHLAPRESTKVGLSLTARDLAFVGVDHQWIAEAGDFTLSLGQLSQKVTLTATKVFPR